MVHEILFYPHPILRETCIPFDFANSEHIALAAEMRAMVGPNFGRGLAAPLLGVTIEAPDLDGTPFTLNLDG